MSARRAMARGRRIAAAAGMACLAGVLGAAQPGEDYTSPEARAHVARAVAIAGEDLAGDVAQLCRKPRPSRVTGLPPPPGTPVVAGPPRPPEVPFEPTRVFDNVYYFGSPMVGATAIRTSAGIILIDALTLSEDVERILLPGMRQMGLDPADIRYVVLTHAHGDHHGGVKYLRERYPDFRVVMTAADWEYSLKPYYMADGSLDPAPKPPRAPGDIAFTGSHDLTLGNTRMRLIETPGHTPGTASLLYTVQVAGQPHTVMHWGGGTPLGTEYSLDTVSRFIGEARAAGATIRWSSHADAAAQRAMGLVRAGEGANPFVQPRDRAARYLDVVMACKQAAVAQQ